MFAPETVILDLLHPIQQSIGDRWEAGQICIAEERLATNFIRQRLIGMMQIHEPFTNGPRLVALCAPDEAHEIGLMMFTLLMELRGWEAIYLGANVGIEGMGDLLQKLSPALVYVNLTMLDHMGSMLDMCRFVRAHEQHGIVLSYGGRVFHRHPELQQRISGRYLGSNILEAVNNADALLELVEVDRTFRTRQLGTNQN